MPLMSWNEKLQIGIEKMDLQHQRWLEMMNSLHAALQEKQDREIVKRSLLGMIMYTRTHFIDEEKLLFENGYPDYANHKKLHDDFVNELEKLRISLEQTEQSDWMLIMELIKLMSGWLANHIRVVDQQYAPFLKAKGIK